MAHLGAGQHQQRLERLLEGIAYGGDRFFWRPVRAAERLRDDLVDDAEVVVTVSDRGAGPLEQHLAQPRRRYGRAAAHGPDARAGGAATDAHARGRGEPHGRPRVKVVGRDEVPEKLAALGVDDPASFELHNSRNSPLIEKMVDEVNRIRENGTHVVELVMNRKEAPDGG